MSDQDRIEHEARKLGFVRSEDDGRWRHPDFRHYVTSRARYAVEDYPACAKSRAMELKNAGHIKEAKP